MSVKCDKPLDKLTVQVLLLYHHPNFNLYWTLIVSGMKLRTDGQIDRRTTIRLLDAPADLSGRGLKSSSKESGTDLQLLDRQQTDGRSREWICPKRFCHTSDIQVRTDLLGGILTENYELCYFCLKTWTSSIFCQSVPKSHTNGDNSHSNTVTLFKALKCISVIFLCSYIFKISQPDLFKEIAPSHCR